MAAEKMTWHNLDTNILTENALWVEKLRQSSGQHRRILRTKKLSSRFYDC